VAGCSGGGEIASGPAGTGRVEGSLEIAAFQGGYGIDFYQAAAKEFESKHPVLKIKVEGNPRIWEQLRPRFIGGNPPDLCYPGWGMDHWALAEEGQLMAFDEALAGKPYEGEGTWGETFEPSILALGKLEGKQYVLPHFFNVLGWWYDPGIFTKNGWTPPKTYEELLALCAKIKARGIAPITYQGKYPYYMVEGMLLPWAMTAGGAEAVRAAQNLEPSAWKSPAMLRAAQMIAELRDKGFFQSGATAMSHTESQQEFLQGKAAMIPCGTWLHSEMKRVMPAGAKMEFMLPPVLAQGKGEPTNVLIGIEPWMIPSDANNPDAAVAFFKYMTSLEKAKQFVEEKGTLVAIRGSDRAQLPEVLVKPAAVFKNSNLVWAVQYRQWYPAFDAEIQNALTAMLNGELTPEAFCVRVEAAAEKTRRDPNITKHKVAG
ncbi:MAG: extracellular solute-binding protein, partial [Armatimonadetes bacterium]|nr:extracellular solute-binding protein [Armatimonadota bacterium]